MSEATFETKRPLARPDRRSLDFFRRPNVLGRLAYKAAEFMMHRLTSAWVGEADKVWWTDESFRADYERFRPTNYRSGERKFTVQQLVRSLSHLEGDTAECGVLAGATSYLICQERPENEHHIFDSFEGLSPPASMDHTNEKSHWKTGDLAVAESIVRKNLSQFEHVHYHAGWIPTKFSDVSSRQFCFVHVDVDLYEPTRDSIEFFYPRLLPGGMLVCDDYGFTTCPGAKQACDEFAETIPESWIHLPTGQALLIRR